MSVSVPSKAAREQVVAFALEMATLNSRSRSPDNSRYTYGVTALVSVLVPIPSGFDPLSPKASQALAKRQYLFNLADGAYREANTANA